MDANVIWSLLLEERARYAADLQQREAKIASRDEEIERLSRIIRDLQRMSFGARSEKMDPDQLALALEDVEQELAAAEVRTATPEQKAARAARRRANRGSLPAHLPRVEQVIDIEDKTCPCCSGALHRIGEDVAERLDVIPATFQALVVRRPKYGCRACEEVVVQAPAPSRLIEGGLPTEATVAHVVVAKYADHSPLYRQAQAYARRGVVLDRSTLAHWTGSAAELLKPVHARLLERLKASGKLFADETRAPVLDPGRGRTLIGQLWAYARDDRPWGGPEPPGVAFVYSGEPGDLIAGAAPGGLPRRAAGGRLRGLQGPGEGRRGRSRLLLGSRATLLPQADRQGRDEDAGRGRSGRTHPEALRHRGGDPRPPA